MDWIEAERRNAALNNFLDSMSDEEIREKNDKEITKAEKDFLELENALKSGDCSICGYKLSHFSVKKPCLHWFLKTKGFKKKYFPLLYEKYSFHRIDAYLRWVANAEDPMKNINDLVEEKSSNKKVETTIKYKNIEWSFSCAKSDYHGHHDRKTGKEPHYHFQMKVDGNVRINYNGFHIPFHDEDYLAFSVGEGKINKIGIHHVQGVGMQGLLDELSPEELLDYMVRSDDYDDSMLHTSTLVMADSGTTMSGEDIANLCEKHKKTGIPMAKLVDELKNVKSTSIISPGPGVPDIAKRTPRCKRGK
ncbi:MAG: hypothetical protein ACKUBY_00090 [Candidatus Moraniibacteriota bacterium]|jgi:hypothetical protein